MKKMQSLCLINGEWRAARSDSTIPVTNPATGEHLADVPQLDQEQVLEAIRSAETALPAWQHRPARERAQVLRRIGDLLQERQDECAQLITLEQGKPLRESLGEVAYSANYFQWFSEEAVRIYGEIIPSDSANKRIFVLKQPIGVAAAITPWNFPIAMLARKMAAALAAGCTFIAKPAPETPLSALFLGALCQEAGLPAGVVNLVTGDAAMIGSTLMASPIVKKVSFTGSTEVGKLLIRQSADTVKKLTLELGGNAPFVVLDDADLEKAVEGAIYGKYRNAGQTCICVNRFLVHESVAQTFTDLLVARTRALVVGNGLDEKTSIGPLINDAARDKVVGILQSASNDGATFVLGQEACAATSRFIPPVVISQVKPSMRIWKEEIFGPVATIATFRTDAEAIALANDTQYGLAAYLYSGSLSRALGIAERLEYGMVGINDTAISAAQAPFGGIKQSGFGREGSAHGIEDYLVLKYLSVA
jgi:succinate-semialdehyde dehydrogenase/glutarate-semialdehyde dehydrogenase